MNTAEFYTKTLDFVATTTEILKIASTLAEKQASTEEAVNDKAVAMVQLLKSAELIDAHQVKRAEAQLKNPGQALDVLKNVVDHYRGQLKESQAKLASATLGTPEGPDSKSTASGFKKNANYVGKRRGNSDGPSEADQALLRLLPGRTR
jgi:hypothetical protein